MKGCFWVLLEDEADTTAEVSLGRDLAIAILADFEASSDVEDASSRRRSLSNNLSLANDDDKRAFFWLSERESGRSLAKCSLLFRRKNANNDDDKVIVSTREPPRNLFIELNKLGSAGSKFVLLISFERTSIIQPTKDWTDCRPWRTFSTLRISSMGTLIEDLDAFGRGTNFRKSSLSAAVDEK